MHLTPVIYRVASLAEGRRLLRELAGTWSTRAVDPCTRRSTLLDTFDWRLCRDDGMLRLETRGSCHALVWTSLAGRPRYRIALPCVPEFVWDLPDGPLRGELEKIVEMRRLLPLAEVEIGARGVEILDEREKTVCRIALESGTVTAPDEPATGRRLAPILRVTPIKGYPQALRKVLGNLDGAFGAVRSDVAELHAVLQLLDRQPCDVPDKQSYDIDSTKRADEAMQSIHRALLETFRRNQAGLREDLDSEFLHDARVAIRRTRSALTQVPGVFPADDVDHFKREFSWLGGITGPTRDLDVYLLNIPGYRAALDAEHRAGLDPLIELLRERQQTAQQQLVTELDTPRLAKLLRDWDAFLAMPPPEVSELPDAMRPIGEVARERIWRAWRKVIKRGREIGPESPIELLHRLRIDCKKLRYLLEFFRDLFGTGKVKQLIAALKKLQTNLGDLNDLALQAEALRGFEHDLATRGSGEVTLTGIEQLVELLEQRRVRERQRFEARFAEFSSADVEKSFRQLFRRPGGDTP